MATTLCERVQILCYYVYFVPVRGLQYVDCSVPRECPTFVRKYHTLSCMRRGKPCWPHHASCSRRLVGHRRACASCCAWYPIAFSCRKLFVLGWVTLWQCTSAWGALPYICRRLHLASPLLQRNDTLLVCRAL